MLPGLAPTRALSVTKQFNPFLTNVVDAVVPLGYIPWLESTVGVHYKVVVCDNLLV